MFYFLLVAQPHHFSSCLSVKSWAVDSVSKALHCWQHNYLSLSFLIKRLVLVLAICCAKRQLTSIETAVWSCKIHRNFTCKNNKIQIPDSVKVFFKQSHNSKILHYRLMCSVLVFVKNNRLIWIEKCLKSEIRFCFIYIYILNRFLKYNPEDLTQRGFYSRQSGERKSQNDKKNLQCLKLPGQKASV